MESGRQAGIAPMKYRISVNGGPFEGDLPDSQVEQISPGLYSVFHEGRSFTVRLLGTDGNYEAIIEGHVIPVTIEDPRDVTTSRQNGQQSGRMEVKSAMPGKVVRLLVAEGDPVEAGQSLIVVEAMKMQNELKSAKTGVVARVHALEGATVQAGEVLIVLE